MDLNVEAAEAPTLFKDTVGATLAIEDQEDQEDRAEDAGHDILQRALMEQRRGASLVPLVATIVAIVSMWSSYSRTSPRSRAT